MSADEMTFVRPRRTGVGEPLLLLAEQGELTEEHLDRVRARVENLQAELQESLLEDGVEVAGYAEAVLEALADAFTLMHYGLDEIAAYLTSLDRGRLRLGRLMLEKGEEEYLNILDELRRTERAVKPGERTSNLWGRLREQVSTSQGEEVGQAIAVAQGLLQAHLEGTQRDFDQALEILRRDAEEAERKMLISLIRFHDFLGLEP